MPRAGSLALRRRWSDQVPRWVFVACLAALFGYFTIYDFHRLNVGHYGDFPTFYQTAEAMRDGRDPYLRWSDQYYVYPPFFAVLIMPLTRLSELDAARLYFSAHAAGMIAALLLSCWVVLDRLGHPHRSHAAFAGALLVAVLMQSEIRGELQMLETDALTLLSFALALWWLDRRPLLAGAALALALSIKYLTILALPYLLIRRRWKAAASMAGSAIALALAPAAVVGWSENLRCLRVALGGLLGRTTGVATAGEEAHVHHLTDGINISVTSALARLAGFAAGGGSAGSDRLGLLAAGALAAGCLGLAAVLYRRRSLPFLRWPAAPAQQAPPFRGLVALEWAGVMVATLVFSPGTNMRQLVIAALPLAVAAGLLLHPAPIPSRRTLLMAVLALAAAFLLPLDKVMSQRAAHLWLACGVACWSLLAVYLISLGAGLDVIRHAASRSTEQTPSLGGANGAAL
jgi:hypothetical protein